MRFLSYIKYQQMYTSTLTKSPTKFIFNGIGVTFDPIVAVAWSTTAAGKDADTK